MRAAIASLTLTASATCPDCETHPALSFIVDCRYAYSVRKLTIVKEKWRCSILSGY
jgi:hypothetical protein